jgi:hypothetical protein
MSEVKVNKISPRTNCGTVQLGDSGDTITIPAGATINNQGTATNFGPTGSVSWQTTVKTSGFTATAGEGYFVDTSSGAVSVNLPAGTAGAVVGFKDYLNSFDTNALTLVQNGSDKIGGSTNNAIISQEGVALTLVFVDSTQGWLVTDSGLQSEAPVPTFISATGGTVTCSGDFKIHTFTGPGTFCVSSVGNPLGSNSVDYLVVAGGGGGQISCNAGGGGGAGGFRFFAPTPSIPGAPGSPLNGPVALPVSAQGYPIAVGGGGAYSPTGSPTRSGSVSSFSTISSAGGGGGGGNGSTPAEVGEPGGSGGGGGSCGPCGSYKSGGTGNTPPVSPPQGNNGGQGRHRAGVAEGGGGGGGAISAGLDGDVPSPPAAGGIGGTGAGLPAAVFGSNGVPCGSYRYYAGGGGGGGNNQGVAGLGGGGNGSNGGQSNPGIAGTANTGGGGGGGFRGCGGGGTGGSGIVVIRYKFQ